MLDTFQPDKMAILVCKFTEYCITLGTILFPIRAFAGNAGVTHTCNRGGGSYSDSAADWAFGEVLLKRPANT